MGENLARPCNLKSPRSHKGPKIGQDLLDYGQSSISSTTPHSPLLTLRPWGLFSGFSGGGRV